jgi:hypothetical protein
MVTYNGGGGSLGDQEKLSNKKTPLREVNTVNREL